jgi:hypothetical protein
VHGARYIQSKKREKDALLMCMSNDINGLRMAMQEKVGDKRARSRAGEFVAHCMISSIISLVLFLFWDLVVLFLWTMNPSWT